MEAQAEDSKLLLMVVFPVTNPLPGSHPTSSCLSETKDVITQEITRSSGACHVRTKDAPSS